MEEKQELVQPSLHRIDEAKLAVCLKTPSEESTRTYPAWSSVATHKLPTIPERASVSFPSSGLPLPQRTVYSSLKSFAQHSTQTFLFDMPQQCTTWPCVCASLGHLDGRPCPVACKRLVDVDPNLLAGDGGSIPEGAKSGLNQLEEPHAHGTTMSLRLTWQLSVSFFKRHACKRALCICGPCGGRKL